MSLNQEQKINRIAILIPTRERLDDFIIFAESWKNTTTGLSDVIVRIDNDDKTYEEIKHKYPDFIYEYGERLPFLDILNEMAVKYSKTHQYVGFMEDDCNFNTPGWEDIFRDKINEIGDYAIVWGNDLLNTSNIVGLPFMNSTLVERLGFMCPPQIKYLWADYFWKHLGTELKSLHYFPNVIIEHRHYSTGKREKDEISVLVDQKGSEDYSNYNKIYLKTDFRGDVERLKEWKD